MDEDLRDQLDDILGGLGCPDTAVDAVMEVVAPIVAERDQYRAVAQFAEAQRAHQRQEVEQLQERERRLRNKGCSIRLPYGRV